MEGFLKLLGIQEAEPQNRLTVRSEGLPAERRVVTLAPGARRR